MIILDSNVWIALFHKEDTLQAKAHNLLENISSKILLPEYVLLEVCSVLKRLKRKQAANQFLDYVLDNRDIDCFHTSPSLLEETIKLFRTRSQDDLSFIDVSLLSLSRFHTIHTFDKKLASAIKTYDRT